MTFHSFGVAQTGTELWTWREAQPAKEFLENNRDHIKAMAEKYNVDTLVLANVLYQERRHMDPMDWHQNQNADKNSTATLGPGQMTIKAFTDMVKENRIELDPQQRAEYNRDPKEFSRQFIVDTKTGIEATAALISAQLDRQHEWGKIPQIGRDGDPDTLSLGQFVYGAALYSRGGRTGDAEFDRKGPTTDHIDFKNNSIDGIVSRVKHDEQIVFAFHYLPDTYEAMYGRKAPSTLGGYFNDRTILRDGDSRASVDDASSPRQVAGNGDRGTQATAQAGLGPLEKTAAQFGEPGQPGREMFDRIAVQVQAQAPHLSEQKIAETSADLAQKSLAARLESPTVALNESGRIFAQDQARAGSPVVFTDPQTLAPDSIARNAASGREQSQTIALNAQMQDTPNQQQEPRSRGMG